ncbi:MAG: adenine nucleotide alpha hydrolase [Pseudomonadota bacterium]
MNVPRPLIEALSRHQRLAIAVSGGIDSMLLAHMAHDVLDEVAILHALSPAVPREATARVRRHAECFGWALHLIDAQELRDPDYTKNPANRCYFCKSNLYGRIAAATDATIASGTNCDDLNDVRPGLHAAAERQVVHPFVEAGIDKAAIYTLAAERGLADIAALPAQPCLASRIETGIAVSADILHFIDAMERALRPHLPPQADLRCRVTKGGVAIEIAPFLDDPSALYGVAAALCAAHAKPFLGVRPYRRGSAFLRASAPALASPLP